MTSISTRTGARRLTYTLFASTVIGGALMLSAPSAFAQPEQDIKSECAESGGTYTTHTDPRGDVRSSCCYEGIFGMQHCDVYINGVLDDDQSFHTPPVSSPPPSGPPPANNVPITIKEPGALR